MTLLYTGWPPEVDPVNLLSYGAGQQSTAMLLLIVRDERLRLYRPNLHVVFSDTRAELPETYATIETMKAYCADRRTGFTHLRPPIRSADGISHEGLEAYCLHLRVIPAKRSDHRWCTDRMKISPIHRWTKAAFPGRRVNMMLGFGAEETDRQVRTQLARNAPTIRPVFPLIEAGFCRHRSIRLLAEEAFPGPVLHSGCFYCPFSKKRYWKWLAAAHPDLFERAARLEENGRGFDRGFTLSHKPLRRLVQTTDRRPRVKPCVCGEPIDEYWGCAAADVAA